MKKYTLFKVKVLNRYRNSQNQYIREQFLKCFLFISEESEDKIKKENTFDYPSYDTYVQFKSEIKVTKKMHQEVIDNGGIKEYENDIKTI